MTSFGIPYILRDSTGNLQSSEFSDLHGRLSLLWRCTARDTTHTAYMIYNTTTAGRPQPPLAALDFGANHSLGTLCFTGIRDRGSGVHMPMKEYLTKISPLGSSKSRKFIASDGYEYRWTWRSVPGEEWTCNDRNNRAVAWYSLPLEGEEYPGYSGCSMTIEENYARLAVEILASLMIMRFIAKDNS